MTLRAITVQPPWSQIIAETAALQALGVAPKTVENRSRPIPEQHIGTDIAIHAGREWNEAGQHDRRVRAAWFTFANAIDLRKPNPILAAIGDTRTGYAGGLHPGGTSRVVSHLWIDAGAVVAVATLVDCHPAFDFTEGGRVCCQPWGEPGQYHLVLDNVRRLHDPVAARGYPFLPWTLPDDVETAVRTQLASVA